METTTLPDSRLRHFHITFFAIVLGMAGFTLAVQKAGGVFHEVSTLLLYLTVFLFVTVGAAYLVKAIKYPQAVREEINHPVKVNFFPLLAKILLVLSVVMLERDMEASLYCWFAGAVLQFISSLLIISEWIRHDRFKIEHMTPGWFIPIVGAIIVPIAGVKHGFVEISWFFFSLGLLFWIILLVIVLYRMFFHAPIAERLMPTLFILFAPPAIGFIAYVRLHGGELDAFARILYYFSLFMFFLVLYQLPRLLKIRFFLSWWAYSFPLAAKTLASFLMADLLSLPFFRILAWVELAILTLAVLVITVKTVQAILEGSICVEEKG
ncbi:MAG: Tellurite resistance protein TehA [Betaproteobacteria bacterium ADurb.Bin341]|nr:MAG: Tellurite resistance protein TehA [Betaproteobacteria bacterium ADurb.Bin341]